MLTRYFSYLIKWRGWHFTFNNFGGFSLGIYILVFISTSWQACQDLNVLSLLIFSFIYFMYNIHFIFTSGFSCERHPLAMHLHSSWSFQTSLQHWQLLFVSSLNTGTNVKPLCVCALDIVWFACEIYTLNKKQQINLWSIKLNFKFNFKC